MPDRKHERFNPALGEVDVDMDDVLVGFMPNLLEPGGVFEREFGIVPEWDGQSWGELARAFTKHPKLLAAGYSSWWDWLRDRDWLWGLAEPVPGAIGAMETLRHRGWFVHIITSKPEWAEKQVAKWLGRYSVPYNRLTVVRNGESKVDFSDGRVIVDDKLATCVEYNKAGRAALWFNPCGIKTYEQSLELNPFLTEVHSWDDVLTRLEAYE